MELREWGATPTAQPCGHTFLVRTTNVCIFWLILWFLNKKHCIGFNGMSAALHFMPPHGVLMCVVCTRRLSNSHTKPRTDSSPCPPCRARHGRLAGHAVVRGAPGALHHLPAEPQLRLAAAAAPHRRPAPAREAPGSRSPEPWWRRVIQPPKV